MNKLAVQAWISEVDRLRDEDELLARGAWHGYTQMHEGITDEVCGKDVEGPFTVAFTWTGTGSDDDFTPPVRKIEGGNSG